MIKYHDIQLFCSEVVKNNHKSHKKSIKKLISCRVGHEMLGLILKKCAFRIEIKYMIL